MADDLLDLVPAAETVAVRGKNIEIRAVSVRDIISLMTRFPALLDAMSGKGLDAQALVASGGDIVGAIIAAATGHAGDERREAVASSLAVEDQLTLLEAALRVTLPNGLAPLAERLAALGGIVGAEPARAGAPRAQPIKLPKRSSS